MITEVLYLKRRQNCKFEILQKIIAEVRYSICKFVILQNMIAEVPTVLVTASQIQAWDFTKKLQQKYCTVKVGNFDLGR